MNRENYSIYISSEGMRSLAAKAGAEWIFVSSYIENLLHDITQDNIHEAQKNLISFAFHSEKWSAKIIYGTVLRVQRFIDDVATLSPNWNVDDNIFDLSNTFSSLKEQLEKELDTLDQIRRDYHRYMNGDNIDFDKDVKYFMKWYRDCYKF